MGSKTKYPIEEALTKVFLELARFIRKAGDYLFTIRKNKEDKIIHMMEIGAWILLTISLVMRIRRW